jgi:predicted DNA-binding transcriptional regulator AlpA
MKEGIPQHPAPKDQPKQKAKRRARMGDRLPEVVAAAEAAALIGCSERSFHEIRQREGFPAPIKLFGPLRPRWRVADLRAWIESLPALDPQPMPTYLIEGKRRKRAARGQGGGNVA